MMLDFIYSSLTASADLFLDMSPYLVLGMTAAGLLSAVLKPSLILRFAGGNSLGAVLRTALFGVPLPLCSCGVLPAAVFLKDNGASKPAVQSFLISTPQTGFDSLIAAYGILGPVMAIYRAVTAFLLGALGGGISRLVHRDQPVIPVKHSSAESTTPRSDLKEELRKGLRCGFVDFIDDIAVQFLIGLGVAGIITAALPENLLAGTVLSGGITGMLFITLASIPLYMCSTSSIPVAAAMMTAGISPGTAFVMLTAGPATNAASIAVLGRKLGTQDTAIYISVLVFGSILFGLVLDAMISLFGWEQGVLNISAGAPAELLPPWATVPSAALLALLMLFSLGKRLKPSRTKTCECSK